MRLYLYRGITMLISKNCLIYVLHWIIIAGIVKRRYSTRDFMDHSFLLTNVASVWYNSQY